MTYEYQTTDGQLVEREFPMGEAPWQFEDEEYGYLKRVFGAFISIPEYMRAGSDSSIQHYDKRHWRARKYF